MPDILWADVAACFEIDGSVKLVYVEAAGFMTIWKALMEWVSTRGPDHRYTETGAAGPVVARPAAEEIFGRRSRLAKPHLQSLSGWIAPGIQARLFFSRFNPAWFAVSQSDIQSQAELEVFTGALAALGRRLGCGPYQALGTAQDTVSRWCAAEGRGLAGRAGRSMGTGTTTRRSCGPGVYYLLR